MSILNSQPISQAKMAANRLVQMTRQTFQQNVNAFNMGAKLFWNNPGVTPAQIAAELGTDAVEVFQLHALLGQMLAGVDATKIAEGAGVVGEFTMNQDGTVTIAEPENPS